MANDRYGKGVAPEVDPTLQKDPIVKKSDFNLSASRYCKALDGMIIPIDLLRVLPNSHIELGYNLRAIMTNPYVKQLLSGKRGYVHAYYSDLSDIWEGAPELIKKGRNFTTNLQIPTLAKTVVKKAEGVVTATYDTLTAGSPAAYMGLPVSRYEKGSVETPVTPIENLKPIDTSSATAYKISDYDNFKFSALPLAMYQQIYQAHFLAKNLINNNKDWLPEVENHFILPMEVSGYDVARLSYDPDKAKDNEIYSSEDFDFNSDYFVPRDVDSDHPTTKSNAPLLNVPRFCQFKGDMFINGSPFADLMRGDTPVMSFSDLTGTIDWSDVLLSSDTEKIVSTVGMSEHGLGIISSANNNSLALRSDNSAIYGTTSGSYPDNVFNAKSSALKSLLDKAVVTVQNQLSFNLNQLRALDVYTLLGERAARTDGSYNQYIKTMFGVNPKYHNHEPRYLGGFYFDFVNQTIDQTSESGTTPLGTKVSNATANNNGYIGKFSFDDHGYIMVCLNIVDENIYTQGVDRDWTDLTFDDIYLPQFNGLSPQATLQQELFLTGTKASNEDPFNFVERFSHLKSRRNKAVGQMSLPAYIDDNGTDVAIDLESASYFHARRFTSKVEFNNKFVTMTPKNIDMTPYTSVNDYPFIIEADANIDAVLPLPYITVPMGLTTMA